jgi:peptidoglycan/LPS O-acetylase OafA/YrhL
LTRAVLVVFSVISLYLYFKPTGMVDVDRYILSWSVFFVLGYVFYEISAWKTPSHGMYFIALVVVAVFLAASNDIEIVTLLITVSFLVVSAILLALQKDYKFGRIDRLAGDLSYPTYILHIVFFGPTIKLLGLTGLASLAMLPQFLLTTLVHIVVSTGVAYLALKFISDPIDHVRLWIRDSKFKEIVEQPS